MEESRASFFVRVIVKLKKKKEVQILERGVSPLRSHIPSNIMIELVGYARGCFGLGHNLRAISTGLTLAGIPHRLCPIVVPGHNFDVVPMPDVPVVDPKNDNNTADITIYCFHEPHPQRGKKKYCLVAWETEVIPPDLDVILKQYDGLLCISPFVQEVLSKHGYTSHVLLIPGAEVRTIPKERAIENLRHLVPIPPNAFVVLFVFDFASTLERKNPGGAVLAFEYAFSSNENVVLVIKSINSKHYPFSTRIFKQFVQQFSKRILWIDECTTRGVLDSLYNVCDVYLSLHRSEGWGLTIVEAMSIGKPVVVTAYSGNLAFNSCRNSCMVPFVSRKEASNVRIYRDAEWVEPSVFHAAAHLRRLYRDASYRKKLGERGKEAVDQINYTGLAETLTRIFGSCC